MAENAPAYLWYPKDVMSSGRVMALADLEELWYRRALDQSFLHNGLPADPADFAGWVGRGCTTAAAAKLIEKFFDHRIKKFPAKVFNKKQEQLRTKMRKKFKNLSNAGKESGRKRREQRDLSAEQMFNDVHTSMRKSNLNIKEIDIKRLIDACARENPQIDARLVEIGILYTLIQRNGSTEPIRSMKYFAPEIAKQAAAGLGNKAIDALLERRRQQWSDNQAKAA